MATTTTDIKTAYPIPSYRFNVEIIGSKDAVGFTEVSGLAIEREVITYKDGLGIKYMPGMPAAVKLTLKRGVVKGNTTFYTWINSIQLNKVEKKEITISLMDEENKPIVTWTVQNAFPTKLAAPTFDGKSNEVAIETLELTADGLTIENKT